MKTKPFVVTTCSKGIGERGGVREGIEGGTEGKGAREGQKGRE